MTMHEVIQFSIKYGPDGWNARVQVDSDEHGAVWLDLGWHCSVGDAADACKAFAQRIEMGGEA